MYREDESLFWGSVIKLTETFLFFYEAQNKRYVTVFCLTLIHICSFISDVNHLTRVD